MYSHSLPLVSVITVNYKQTDVTIDFLKSISNCTYGNFEVIVVDNGSGQDLGKILKSQFQNVHFIESNENLGFAGGNNLGILEAKGKYLFFLNNDTEVDPNIMEPLVDVLEKDSSVGMVSPKIVFYDAQEIVQYAGSDGINPYTGRARNVAMTQEELLSKDQVRETSLGHGAAMMVPMETIQKVGMMPDIFFLYYEEHDWCEAIKRAGYKIVYNGSSTVYHKESVSVGKNSPLKTYYMARNRILFLRRNNKGIAFITSLLVFLFLAVPKTTFNYLIKFDKEQLKAFYKGMIWNLFHYNVFSFPPYHLK